MNLVRQTKSLSLKISFVEEFNSQSIPLVIQGFCEIHLGTAKDRSGSWFPKQFSDHCIVQAGLSSTEAWASSWFILPEIETKIFASNLQI